MCLCMLQIVLTVAFAATGGTYLSSDLLNDMRHFHTTHEEINGYIIFITMFSVISSLLGLWTARSRLNPGSLVCVYALITFIGVVLPLLAQGAALNHLASKDESLIEQHC